jgi:hypothetical protein
MPMVPNLIWQIDDNIESQSFLPRVEDSSFFKCLMDMGYGSFTEFKDCATAAAALPTLPHPCNLLVLMDYLHKEQFVHTAAPGRQGLENIRGAWGTRAANGEPCGDLQFIYYTSSKQTQDLRVMERGARGIVSPRDGLPTSINLTPKYQEMSETGLHVTKYNQMSIDLLDGWALMQHAILPEDLNLVLQSLLQVTSGQITAVLGIAGTPPRHPLAIRLPLPEPLAPWACKVFTILSRYDAFFPRGVVYNDKESVSYNYDSIPWTNDLPFYSWMRNTLAIGLLLPANVPIPIPPAPPAPPAPSTIPVPVPITVAVPPSPSSPT